ncbi:hypothetical protein OBBRIDRAFT_122569 [Obba rivulosa]|uniref:Thioesterase domain-containing protein n=1 Tax=Obba rivulosa TaxID=1052685 RepID=A0A8E2DRQ0_9APHY|nr:hypothetical protein OBBRIDRAFT_122569 [Obba rivulosa]
MMNRRGHMHRGCIVTLIDVCTSLVLVSALDDVQVSQVLNTLYHVPVPTGSMKVRIV